MARNTQQEFLEHAYSRSHLPFDRLTCPCSSTFRQAHDESSLPKSDGLALSTVVPSLSIIAVNRQAWGEDTLTPTRSKCSPEQGEGMDRKTDHGVRYDSISSPLLLPGLITEWNYCGTSRLCRCSEYRLLFHLDQLVIVCGGCDYRACMRAMSIATPIQIG